MIKKGSFVRIHRVLLTSEERAGSLPEDTRNVPLEMWTKGYLLEDANLGSDCKVRTMTGRLEEGTLIDVNHNYNHNYGKFVPEVHEIGPRLRKILFGGEADE